ncbi:small multi-drug export protein [Cohnella rhizosphaerae]|uniref:Small multi-drug export protein n=1 Tax=Cohnella rhizosphaerae TaxID=1457232 RepID=A0A9X4KTE8_9BACL|nr:small multi-drug export protein [Cohnella rhizosphaerae]MDG0810438.1 small multi-drug export protein [Cohnella rhizosphaerae]
MTRDMLKFVVEHLKDWDPLFQYAGILLIAGIPFAEAIVATMAGTILELPLIGVFLLGIVGNLLSVMIIIAPFHALFRWLRNRPNKKSGFVRRRSKRAREIFDTYGVPGLALISPLIASGHIAAFTSLAAGTGKRKVILWHTLSIVVYSAVGLAVGLFLKARLIE